MLLSLWYVSKKHMHFMGLKTLVGERERELRCNSARQDYAFSGAICTYRVWKEEENVVSLTGESLSGAGIRYFKLAGAASRVDLMELTARLGDLSAVQVAGSRRQVWDTGYISLCSWEIGLIAVLWC